MSEGSNRGELIDKVIKIKRCAAVVKGGRRFSFAAMVVVGNGRGKVGWGYGKANEVPPSVEKAVKEGSRSMFEIALDEGTIPHQIEGRFGSARVVLVPASPGTGVIAGDAVRAVCEAAGIHNILTKSFGSNNPVNLVKASIEALKQLRMRAGNRAPAGSDAGMNLADVNRGIRKHKKKKRVGRGPGSGHGKTSGRGHKGQGQLAGWSAPSIFEGGASPLIRRIPKRGFHNAFAKVVKAVNVGDLNDRYADGDEVTLDSLRERSGQGSLRRVKDPRCRRVDKEA